MNLMHDPIHFSPELTPAHAQLAKVLLVGAGPGDVDLLTVKATRALQSASLVLYDQLVSPDVLALIPATAERVFVGKSSGHHAMPQGQIIQTMIDLARAGRPLVRLKGGDPFIFGRGGEEAQGLAAAGVPFEVVPGISAAQGVGASVGIPLTHRDHANAVIFAAGHLRGDGDQRHVDLNWHALAQPQQTVVIYMGVAALPLIAKQLQAHGLPAETPAAIVENGSLPNERVVTGTLATLPTLALAAQIKTPALIIIGGVVSVRDQLMAGAAAWQGQIKPL